MARLLSSLPVGAKVVDKDTKYNGVPITWLVGGHNHYATNQTVLVSKKIITLKAFDAKEPTNTNASRASYGNNRYGYSNLRQWLNSDKTSWYSPQHSADAPPTNENLSSNYNEYDAEAGFLTNFSVDLRNALLNTSLTVAKNTQTDGGGSETVTDKVFLLSNTEVGLTNENSVAEGKLLSLFSNDASRQATPTQEAVSKSEYKDPYLVSGEPWHWWLRTPRSDNVVNPRIVFSSGILNSDAACYGYRGVRPALNMSSAIKVSDNVNSNGEYEVIWSYLTPSDRTDLGSVTDNTSILKYTPTAYPVGTTVTEKINGVVVGTKTIVNDTEYTVSATLAQWNAVKYGKYKDTLGNKNVVTLEVSTGEIYTYPFTKTLPTTAKTNDVLVAVHDMSNIAMESHKKKLVDAIGNKATVGGTGTLEDIAKAIESISVESLGGMKVASGTFTFVNAYSSSYASVRGLSFAPKAIVWLSDNSDRPRGVDFKKDFYKTPYGSNWMQDDVIYTTDSTGVNSRATFTRFPNGFDLMSPSSYDVNKTCRYVVFG